MNTFLAMGQSPWSTTGRNFDGLVLMLAALLALLGLLTVTNVAMSRELRSARTRDVAPSAGKLTANAAPGRAEAASSQARR
jgi:hypothetical protein